jgi:hypothetical protein
MKTSSASSVLAPRVSRHFQPVRLATLLGVVSLIGGPLVTQAADAGKDDRRRGGERGSFDPQAMQERMLNALRERLEITDDEEWKVISERIAKLNELRRSSQGGLIGMMAGRGGPPGKGDRGSRPSGGSPEMSQLAFAIRDKLPDAEIKNRLERLREVRKESEAKLTKAQEDLRAVLTVRQEAVAVMFGLLP